MNEQEKKARDVIENLDAIKSLETDKDIAIRVLKERLAFKSLSKKGINTIENAIAILECRNVSINV